jgi:hypothetical protein
VGSRSARDGHSPQCINDAITPGTAFHRRTQEVSQMQDFFCELFPFCRENLPFGPTGVDTLVNAGVLAPRLGDMTAAEQ